MKSVSTRPREGAVYLLPTSVPGGWACLISRVEPRSGVPLGYFFEDFRDIQTLNPKTASLVSMFADFSISKGAWKCIGCVEPWVRSSWPVPLFVRKLPGEDLANGVRVVRYSDDLVRGEVVKIPLRDAVGLPSEAIPGYSAIERKLRDVFAEKQVSK